MSRHWGRGNPHHHRLLLEVIVLQVNEQLVRIHPNSFSAHTRLDLGKLLKLLLVPYRTSRWRIYANKVNACCLLTSCNQRLLSTASRPGVKVLIFVLKIPVQIVHKRWLSSRLWQFVSLPNLLYSPYNLRFNHRWRISYLNNRLLHESNLVARLLWGINCKGFVDPSMNYDLPLDLVLATSH